MPTLTENEVIAEIARLSAEEALRGPERPAGAFLAREMASAMGCGIQTAYSRLDALESAGAVEPAWFSIRQRNGRDMLTSGYRLIGGQDE